MPSTSVKLLPAGSNPNGESSLSLSGSEAKLGFLLKGLSLASAESVESLLVNGVTKLACWFAAWDSEG